MASLLGSGLYRYFLSFGVPRKPDFLRPLKALLR